MTQQIINVGATPNDGAGDPIRTAFIKSNNNFSQLYSRVQVTPPTSLVGEIGDEAGMYAYDSTYFYYCFANYDGSSIIWAQVTQVGNISTNQINSGNSNVIISGSGGNVVMGINGVTNAAVFTSTTANLVGNVVSGGYFIGDGSLLTGLPQTYANANVTAYAESGWGGNIVPSANATYNLGSATNQWKSLYVSNTTIYLGNVPIGITAGNVLTVNGNAVLTNGSNANISTSGNVTVGAILTDGYYFANGNPFVATSSYGNANVVANLAALASNPISTSGNVTAGNLGITGGSLTWANASIVQTSASDVSITGDGQVTVRSLDGTYQWTFDNAGNTTVPGNIIPQSNVSYSLGDATHQWKDLYVSGNTIYFNNVPVSMDGNTLSVDGRPLYPGVEVGQPGSVVLDSPINANGPFPDVPVIIDQVTLQLADPTQAYLRWGHIPGIYTPTMSGGTSGNITNIVITNPGLYPLTDAVDWPVVNEDNMFALPAGTDISDYANIWAAYQVYVPPYGPLAANIASTTTTVASDGFIYLTGNTGLAPTAQGNGMVLTVNTGAGPLNWTLDSTGNLTLPGNTSSINYANGDPYGGSGVAGFPLANGTSNFDIATANGNVTVTASGTETWTFGDDGNLLLPRGGIVYETSIPGGTLSGNTIALKPQGGIDADQQLLIYPTAIGTDDNHLHLTSGNLYNTELFLGSDNLYVKLANTGNVVINSNDSVGNSAQWTFAADGNLTIPNDIVSNTTIDIDNRASGNGADIQLFAADDITLQARDRSAGSTSEGGDINIFAGDSAEDGDSSGGDIQILAGDGGEANVDFGGPGGFITIQSGQGGAAIGNSGYSAESGGALTLNAGDAGSNNGNIDLGADGGNVYIGAGDSTGNGVNGGTIYLTSGAADASALAGDVVIQAGGTWTFDGDGRLTFPGTPRIDTDANNFEVQAAENISLEANVVVNIYTDSSGNTYQWQFGDDGSLTFPIGISIDANVDPLYPKIIADSGKLFSVQGQGNTGSAALAWTVDPNAASQYAAVAVSRAGDNLAKVVLQAQSDSGNVGTVKLWNFDETGNLTLPGNLVIAGNTSVFGTDAALIQTTDNRPLLALSSGANGAVSSLWVEDIGNVGTSNIAAVYVNPVPGSKIVRIAVGQNGSPGPNLWDFDAAGNLTLPNGAVIKDTAGNAVAFGLDAGQSSQGDGAVAIGVLAGNDSQGQYAVAIGIDAGSNTQGVQSVAIGVDAGKTTQGNNSVSIGTQAGNSSQGNDSVAIGYRAGQNTQSANAVAVGYAAGNTSQGNAAVAIGIGAGLTSQGNAAVAVGAGAGNNNQGLHGVAIGTSAGNASQSANAVAVGYEAGNTSQGQYAVAMGFEAGKTNQGAFSVAVGYPAGQTNQGNSAVAIGSFAGAVSQSLNAVAVGVNAGTYSQGIQTVAVGALAGSNVQGQNSVAIGVQAGYETQGVQSVAIGIEAGKTTQGQNSVAIGTQAGNSAQGQQAVAIGYLAGNTTQGNNSVAIGRSAGETQGQEAVAVGLSAGFASQGNYAVAIGKFSANSSQGNYAVAVGPNAGFENQLANAVAIGSTAGASSQGINSIAIGVGAAYNTQGNSAVAVGNSAGYLLQGLNSVAIGDNAGFAFQGVNSVAVGRLAGNTNQGNNSIIINATGAVLDQTTANTFTVAPVRNDVANVAQVMFYNTTSKEITYGNVISVSGNISGGNLSLSGNITSSIGFTGATITINNAPGGVEGAEIQWALPSPANTSLSGTFVQDVYANGMRFFESSGNTRGLYMDLGNAPNGSTTAVGYRDIPQVAFTANTTITTTDAGRHYYSTLSTGNVLTIANNASQGFQVGAAISIINQGTGNITVAQGSGVTLYLAGNATSGNRTVATFGMATLIKVATDTWFINGTGVT